MSKTASLLVMAVLILGLGACATGGSRGPQAQAGSSGDDSEPKLEAAVRFVPHADRELLWKAAHGYVARHFPLDIDDPAKGVVETETMEWEADKMPWRTRITVQVIADPERPDDAQLGVLARMMQPRYDMEAATTGRPLWTDWKLVGTHEKMQDFVASRIIERYLLLRQGRDPDLEMSKNPIDGVIRKAND